MVVNCDQSDYCKLGLINHISTFDILHNYPRGTISVMHHLILPLVYAQGVNKAIGLSVCYHYHQHENHQILSSRHLYML